MVSYQTFQGVPALSTLPGKDRQLPIDLHNDDTEPWCHWSLIGRSPSTFQFWVEYQKGCNNTVADVISQVTTWLDPDPVKSILNGVAIGTVHRAETHDSAMVESDHHLEQEVHVAAGHLLVQMHVTDWAGAQREDPVLSAVLDWLEAQKRTDLKALLAKHASSKEGQMIL